MERFQLKSPAMNKAQQFWDKQAKRFDNTDKHYEDVNAKLLAGTKEYLNANDNVLDFGCATGTKTLRLAGSVKHIHGLDFSAEMIGDALKKKDEMNISNASFSHGTIFNNDLENSSFDKITAFSIIHLLDDCEKAIERMNELLRPGGLLIAETACFKDKMDIKVKLQFAFFRIMKPLGLFPLHLNMFRISDLELLIKNKGFNILKSESIFFNGMTISFLVAEKY
jgi:ubiquinone/menaquinone biosynthesis C-methylase UbiE